MNVLNKIQTELKVHKGQYNSFNNFYFRSCEDILEAVKPLLQKYESTLLLSDKVLNIGNRYYIEATATLTTPDGVFQTTACAREEEARKSFDASQITGSASSYARKYALNGLFAIDDTKDADTRDNRVKEEKPRKELSKEEKEQISLAKDEEELREIANGLLKKFPKKSIEKYYNERLAQIKEEEATLKDEVK